MLKLLKHEFKVNRSAFLSFYAAVLVLSLLLRLTNFTNISDDTAGIVVGLLMMIYIFGIMGCYIYVMVAIVRAFNKSMFKKQGYLTLTLPVSTGKLVLSKLLMAAFWIIISTVVVFLSFVIMIPDFAGAMGELGEFLVRYGFDLTLWLTLVLLLFSLFEAILLFFFCCTFVNTKYVKGHRLIIGIGVYMVIYFVTSFVQSFFMNNSALDALNGVTYTYSYDSYLNETATAVNDVLSSTIVPGIVFALVISVLCFFGIKYLVDKKIELD
jgi:hypothetical protein